MWRQPAAHKSCNNLSTKAALNIVISGSCVCGVVSAVKCYIKVCMYACVCVCMNKYTETHIVAGKAYFYGNQIYIFYKCLCVHMHIYVFYMYTSSRFV